MQGFARSMRDVDQATHRRYLDYRERHAYFQATTPVLTREQFLAADAEHRTLEDKGENGRDDDDEERWQELAKLLLSD